MEKQAMREVEVANYELVNAKKFHKAIEANQLLILKERTFQSSEIHKEVEAQVNRFARKKRHKERSERIVKELNERAMSRV
jgi:predicted glycoside hydrolase/deacetylase ChbG (UPF0249 family)